MRFKTDDDELLSMDVVAPDSYLVTVTDAGFGKRTSVDEWNAKGRGTQGVRAMRLVEDRGGLVGALICAETDEIFSVATNGVVIRTRVAEVKATGRDTMGVRLQALPEGESVVAVARADAEPEGEDEEMVDEFTDESVENVEIETGEEVQEVEGEVLETGDDAQ